MSCLSTDPKHVHNSSTDIVDNIYNCLCPYKRKQNDYQHCLQITFYETFHGRKLVRRNLTCNTSGEKRKLILYFCGKPCMVEAGYWKSAKLIPQKCGKRN